MRPEEYVQHDATALADLVRRGDVTPAELLAVARERRDAVNPVLNAIVTDIDADADARAAGEPSGPFGGVPFLVKDLGQEYAGLATSSGSRALRHDVADRHALVTQRFLDAGLNIFGKTNTPELGAKGVTESDHLGPARNPWNTGRTPGGSSGGSGAAVASGIVPAAGANDGGGSVRIPAACNGLVGLKLSRGVGPYGPQTGEVMFGMVTQGVVSRTVRDSAGLLDAIIGPDSHADYQQMPPTESFTDAIGRAPGKLRIGWSAKSAITADPDPEAIAAVEDAARLLEELGHEVEEVAPPHDDEALARDFLTIWFAQVHGQVRDIRRRTGASPKDFEADTLAMAELGRATGVGPLMDALHHVPSYTRALADFHDRYDYFLTPTLAKAPLPVLSTRTPNALQRASRVIARVRGGKALNASGVMDQLITDSLGWVPYTQLANLTGRPAISVPLHWTADGLPLGVQLVGRLGADGALLQLAAQLEQARPWSERYRAAENPTR